VNVLHVLNVNSALYRGLSLLRQSGRVEDSRNGPVLVAPGPVCTVYRKPAQRVMFSALRDANPFFHLMEALWMLAGRNDVDFVSRYNSRMAEFSDDGDSLHGAYGFRWRQFFSFDQLKEVIALLRRSPETRRAVVGIWSPSGDLVASEGIGGIDAKDVPCNTQVYFSPHNGVLDMTVMCRSNDIVWGAYGANAVHFSMLHEFVAGQAGMQVGTMYQFSNNYHAYRERPDVEKLMQTFVLGGAGATMNALCDDRYHANDMNARVDYFIMHGLELPEIEAFCEEPGSSQKAPFLAFVAQPMHLAWAHYKAGDFASAERALEPNALSGPRLDWHVAGREWLQRRKEKRNAP